MEEFSALWSFQCRIFLPQASVYKDCFDDFKYCKETTLSTQTLESNCERVNVTETVVQQNAGFFRVMPRQRIPIVRLCDILESES